MNKEFLKYIYIRLLRNLRRIFFIIPIIRNRVVFESFSGDAYSCNPKYISEELRKQYGDSVEIIWAFNDPNKFKKELPKEIVTCRYRSFNHLIYRITSKVYVCNFLQAIEIPKRKGQLEIQTWHGGGCYKKVGVAEKGRQTAYVKRQRMHVEETDLFITSSKYFENEVVKKQFGYKGETLSIGMPRNDILINLPVSSQVEKLKEKLGLPNNKLIALYAPTWRSGTKQYETLDIKKLTQAVEKKFGKKCIVLFRSHLYGNQSYDDVVDVSQYSDMQELLLLSDILITDYSSSMWDFSLSFKPCFLYTPDLKDYLDERGFDEDIHSWGCSVSESNKELVENILQFDNEEYRQKMKNHHQFLESYEQGDAAKRVVAKIAEYCNL